MNTTVPVLLTLTRYDDPSQQLLFDSAPPSFTESYGTEWTKLKVPGLSHSVKQFTQTLDRGIQFKVELLALDHGTKGVAKLRTARDFLKRMCRPRATPGAIVSAGSPLVVFFWSNFTTLVGNIETVNFTYNRFNRIGELVEMTVDVKMEEVRTSLITAEDDDGSDAFPGDSVQR